MGGTEAGEGNSISAWRGSGEKSARFPAVHSLQRTACEKSKNRREETIAKGSESTLKTGLASKSERMGKILSLGKS